MLLDDLIKSGLRNVPIYFFFGSVYIGVLGHSNALFRHHAKNLGMLDGDQYALQITMIFSMSCQTLGESFWEQQTECRYRFLSREEFRKIKTFFSNLLFQISC